jgi:hypothetical protein
MAKAIVRRHYWDKNLKKHVWKSVYSLKKFDNDIEKANEFLDNWVKSHGAPDPMILSKSDVHRPTISAREDPDNEDRDNLNIFTDSDSDNQIESNSDESNLIETNTDEVIPLPEVPYTAFKLNIDDLKETGTSTVIFGASKSGKTTLLKDILDKYYSGKNVITLLIADNVHSNIYKKIDSSIIKTDRFDTDLIADLHKIQKKTDNKYHFVIVMDDMILQKNDPKILQMMLTMRNAKISTVILLQSPTLLSKNGRFNGNNFIFKRTNNHENAEQVMKFFLGGFGIFYGLKTNEKIKLFRDITDDYGFVYLDALNDKITYHKSL